MKSSRLAVSNEQFLQAIFGGSYSRSHVTSFTEDPTNLASGVSRRCWAGHLFKDRELIPNSNQFYTVSLFKRDEQNKSNRRKANFEACYVVALDDVKEKLPIDQVMRLPSPSIVLKSSLHSEQWLYLLQTPETNADRIDNLHDGLIKNGLAPDGKDPGMKGVTRYLRLPEGVNTKAKRITENNGIPPRCEVTEWHPERRYTLDQLAEPFGVDLNTERKGKNDSGSDVPDHPILNTGVLNIKQHLNNGRYDITCPWVDEHTGKDDSGSAMFTNTDGSIGFKCHHGSCESRTGADFLNYIESVDAGFCERLKQWQITREFSSIEPAKAESTILTSSPLSMLLSSSANGSSVAMKTQMMIDKFILKDLAIQGQFTVLYAGPNTGKTLITLWLLKESIKSSGIDGLKVFYANCDDNYKGGVQKLEIAEQTGFNMLLPNVNDWKPESLLTSMQGLAEQGEAKEVVIVLDTLKKFTDLMDKRTASQFGSIARNFVSAGGSLICLAHVNKHKDSDGKSVYAGTSDIRDDADCVYTIEHLGSTGDIHTIEFENNKSRGAVAQKVTFQYEKQGNYNGLFDSVRRLNNVDAALACGVLQEESQRSLDADVIEAIKAAIVNGQTSKTNIVSFVLTTTDISRNKVRTVLEQYEDQLWLVEKGDKNLSIYSLNDAPMPKVSFL